MRTISFRLDERTDALLMEFCRRHGVSQTDALKTAIARLASVDRPKPSELAADLGLIGSFRSAEGDLGEQHSARLKERLRTKLERDQTVPLPTGSTSRRA